MDGRGIAYSEWGDRAGGPVVLLHGMPGSRLLCPDVDATVDAGLRLLTIDRPGYGGSDPCEGRTITSWVADFVAVLDDDGVERCRVVGWSSGGAYALACAALLSERVSAVALVGTVAPVETAPGGWARLEADIRPLVEMVRRDPSVARPLVVERCAWFAEGWEAMFTPGWAAAKGDDGREDPDDRLLADPKVLEPVLRSMQEAARQGAVGYVDDWVAEALPWGFDLSGVTQPVVVWWGDGDVVAHRADSEYLARSLPRASLRVVPGAGHLLPIEHWASVLDDLGGPS